MRRRFAAVLVGWGVTLAQRDKLSRKPADQCNPIMERFVSPVERNSKVQVPAKYIYLTASKRVVSGQ